MSKVYNFLENSRGKLIAPVVTWLDADGEIDTVTMGKHVDYLLLNGVNGGIFVLGSTGSFPYFTMEQKKELVTFMVDHVKKRVPVMVGISSLSTRESIALGKMAVEAGADALIAIVPEYFKLGPGDVERYYRALSQSLDRDVPLVLYYMPILSSYELDPALVFKLAKDKVIHGIKYTGLDSTYVKELRELVDGDYSVDCNIWVGIDRCLMDCLENNVKIDGAIMGSLNVFPGFYNAVMKTFNADPRDEGRCRALSKTSAIIQSIFSMELRELPSLVKETLKAGGVPFAGCTKVVEPLPVIRDSIKHHVVETLAELKKKGIVL
ncbi:MAG: dihydrodipicolinate synthase family protein [Promethearchaeota archaeon]